MPDLSHYNFFIFAVSMVAFLSALWVAYGTNEKKRKAEEEFLKQAVSTQKFTITNQKLEQLRLQKQTVHDPYTNAYNRDVILEMLQLEVIRSKRYKRPCSIMLVEVDHYDTLSKNYGFEALNNVVADVVSHCRQQLRPYDMIGRTAADQFLLLLVEAEADGCPHIAERVHANVGRSPVAHGDNKIGYSVNIAYCTLADSHQDGSSLFEDCCNRLHTEKNH